MTDLMSKIQHDMQQLSQKYICLHSGKHRSLFRIQSQPVDEMKSHPIIIIIIHSSFTQKYIIVW